MKAKKKRKTAEARKKKAKNYVMYGFREEDPQHTAYLKVSSTNAGNDGEIISGPYSAVSSTDEATVFPSENVFKKKGFGTPYDWAEFFAEEEELRDWNFHPVPFSPKAK